jgi:hypothetical protein
MKKATNAESKFRTDAVYKLLGQGWSRGQIIQYCEEKWGIKVSQTDAYIKKARILLEEDCELERPAWIAEALQRLRKLEQKASEKGQVSAAIQAIQTQAKLIGLET